MVKELGKWWNDKEIKVVEIEGKAIALHGWNGNEYLECFEVKNEITGTWFDIVDKTTTYNVEPIDEPIEFDEEGEPCQWETTDYEIVGEKHKANILWR